MADRLLPSYDRGVHTLFFRKKRNRAGWTKSLPGLVALGVLLGAAQRGLAQQAWPLWESYTKRFVDDQGRVIDRSANDRTTSEGQAYAMFFALVDNDRARFERLLNWTEVNLAHGDLTLHLAAWSWGKSGAGEWKILDDHSASDADLWMAYTLFEAGRLWKEPRFATLGRLIAVRIAKEEVADVAGVGLMLLPGSTGFHPDEKIWVLNPSYMPPPVLAGLAREVPKGPWKAVLGNLPAVVGGVESHQFAMDWVNAGSAGVHPSAPPAQPTAGVKESQASGSYDAIRVYLWMGIADPGTPGVPRSLGKVAGMGGYLKLSATPPLEVSAQGKVLRGDAPVGFSAAVIPYLSTLGMTSQVKLQRDRLVATKRGEDGLYGKTAEYYDQNLTLFSTGWSEQRYRFDRDGRLKVKWK